MNRERERERKERRRKICPWSRSGISHIGQFRRSFARSMRCALALPQRRSADRQDTSPPPACPHPVPRGCSRYYTQYLFVVTRSSLVRLCLGVKLFGGTANAKVEAEKART